MRNKENPLVSIIVPAYNHELYISDLLESIIAQSYPNIELLLVDDDSSDLTFSIAQSYLTKLESKCCRVVMEKNETNQGVTKSLNSLINMADGSYIKTIASDDYMLPTAIEELVRYLEANPQYDSVFSNVYKITKECHYPTISSSRLGYFDTPKYGRDLFKSLYENGDHILVAGKMDRAIINEKYGEYDTELCIDDWDYWLNFSMKGGVLGYIDKPLVMYRYTPGSLSHFTQSEKSIKTFERVLTDEMKILEKYENRVPGVNYKKGWESLVSRRCITACRIHADRSIEVLTNVVKEKHLHLDIKSRIALFLYKIKLFDVIDKRRNTIEKDTARANN